MPTVIDSLVVTLGLDASKYRAGQEDARAQLKRTAEEASRTGKEMEASGKQAASFFAQVKNEALGLAGVLLGAGSIAAFTAQTTRSLAELGREARNIGLSVNELGAFRQMIERNGGSADSAASSMKGLVDQIERFKIFGDPSVFKFLTPIGASIDETPLQIYMKFVKFAEQHKNDVPLVNLIGKGLGFDQSLINATLQIGSLTEAQKQLREEMARSPTEAMTENARKLQSAWEDLRHQAVFTAETIVDKYSPAMRSVLQTGVEVLKQNPELVSALTAVVGGLTAIAAVRISASLIGLTGLSSAVGGLVALLERFAALWATVLALKGDTAALSPDDQRKLDERNRKEEEDYRRDHPNWRPGDAKTVGEWWQQNMPRWLGGGGGSGSSGRGGGVGIADTAASPERKAFLDTLSAGEATNYDAQNPTSTAHGRYQFIKSTDEEVSRQTGLYGNDPVSQDRKAWYLASTTYQRNTGRDLETDVREGGHEAGIAQALRGVWPSLPGGSQQNTTPHQFMTRMRDNLAAHREQARQTNPAGATPAGPAKAPPIPITIDPALTPRPGEAARSSVQPAAPAVTNSVEIGDVTLHTQAKDASGVARDLRRYVDDAFSGDLIPMSNRGLQ